MGMVMGGTSGRRRSAMTPTFGDTTIYLCRDPVDFRLGINGLSTMVEATLKFDPFSRNLFCFVNKRRTQIKALYWQRSGFCLWLKRLEEEKFKWPVHMAPLRSETVRPPVLKITEDEFDWLLEGLDLKHLKPHRALEYRSVL
jgi:transposase